MKDECRKWADDDEDDDDDAQGFEFFEWVTTCCIAPVCDVTGQQKNASDFLILIRLSITLEDRHRYIHTQKK